MKLHKHVSAPIQTEPSEDTAPFFKGKSDTTVQAKAAPAFFNPPATPTKTANKGGLPEAMQTSVEQLSGFAMDDVKVNYNSHKPAQVDALATTEGSTIELGTGQEKHLPHEAWHVVQQKQGRVAPTLQAKGKNINADENLEQEADSMGEKIQSGWGATGSNDKTVLKQAQPTNIIQKLAAVKKVGERLPRDFDMWRTEDLEDLAKHLRGEAAVNQYEIHYDLIEGNAAALLNRLEAKIDQRNHVSERFNVIGRAVDTEGVVFTDSTAIRDMAENRGLRAFYNFEVPNALVNEPNLLNGLERVINQPNIRNTQFYANPKELRGPKVNPAAIRGNPQIHYPPSAREISQIRLDERCQRGDESQSRDKAMGGLSARNYAIQVGFPNADQHTWEWVHLVGASIGGGNVEGNLVAGTYDMNTLMIPFEQTIVSYVKDVFGGDDDYEYQSGNESSEAEESDGDEESDNLSSSGLIDDNSRRHNQRRQSGGMQHLANSGGLNNQAMDNSDQSSDLGNRPMSQSASQDMDTDENMEPIVLTTEVNLWRDAHGRPTWVANDIRMTIEHGTKGFTFGPLDNNIFKMTKMEYNFYNYVFDAKMQSIFEE